MKHGRKTAKPSAVPKSVPKTAWILLGCVALFIILGVAAFSIARQKSPPQAEYVSRPKGELTFSKDIAPIVFQHCAGCHRPGQAAPFALLTYADVKKHAEDVRSVIESGYMPPWPPEPGHGRFLAERRLTVEQVGMITQWLSEGAPEGDPNQVPPLPQWTDDWQLGSPDLVVTMPAPFIVPAEGPDIYRNFVVPVPLSAARYVRAIEFRPGNARGVHHALIKVDNAGEGRRRDALDAQIGFPGMMTAPTDTGHFLGWQPGRGPSRVPEGMPWQVRPGSDLVVQMHLSPGGKPELVQPSIGFYFTDAPPSKIPFRILLTSLRMDIPPGAQTYSVEDAYELPVDVDLYAILPHAHYLGKEIRSWATLPGGRIEPLIYIRNWDFNWQSDYQYATPLSLPRGTRLAMRFTYDNSTNNVRNPNAPPRTVQYGLQSTDEMAELWLQVVPRNPQDRTTLQADYEAKARKRFFEGNLFLAHRTPPDREAVSTVGQILVTQGKLAEAEPYLLRAVSLNEPTAYYGLGLLRRLQQRLPESRQAFERAIAVNPTDARAHGNLGYVCLGLGDPTAAEQHFSRALALNPEDPLARQGLNDLSGAPRPQ